jgi:hypothetical protein
MATVDAGQRLEMSQRTYSKPSLDAESFQRLLAAAFILQSRLDWISTKPLRAAEAKRFAAPPAIAQKRIPSIRPSVAQSAALGEANVVPNLSGAMFWKGVEALAIGIVFCLMMGMLIHHLLADPGRPSPSAILQTRDAGRLTTSSPQASSSSVWASPQQPDEARKSQSLHNNGEEEVDNYDEDLVIHYRPRTANLPGSMGSGVTGNTTLAQRSSQKGPQEATPVTEKVIRYGDDVTMWLSLAQPLLIQPRRAALNREKLTGAAAKRSE